MPPGGVHIRWPDAPLEQEARLFDYKWYAALAYVRANRLNHNVIESPHDRFGIIASGKAFNDTRQALADLGLDDDTCRALGIRLHKVNVVWPLEATITRDFAQGLQEILVVEEKRQVIEYQLKEELYNWRPDVRPNVLGKFDEPEGDARGGEWSMPNPSENWLLRAKADLTPAIIAKAIAKRLKKLGLAPAGSDIAARMDAAHRRHRSARDGSWPRSRPTPASARPGSARAARTTPARACPKARARWPASAATTWRCGWTAAPAPSSQMGGEGVPWVGQAPFTTGHARLRQPRRRHLLPQRLAGDPPEHRRRREHHLQDALQRRGRDDRRPAGRRAARGPLGAADHEQPGRRRRGQARHRHRPAREVRRRGARAPASRCTTATSSTASSASSARLKGTHGHHLRPDLRHREAPPPQARQDGRPRQARGHQRAGLRRLRRLLGAEQLPVGRAGRDRVRPQAPHQPEHLQQGLLLREGLLPELRHRRGRAAEEAEEAAARATWRRCRRCPSRALPVAESAWGIVVGGVGGTGVITIGQLLGMAAHIEGKGVVTQDAGGLAQKGGATWSHIQIANRPDAIFTTKVDTAKADLVIACDSIVGATQVHAGGDAARPHLRGAEHARHADRGLREERRLAVPGRQLRGRDQRTASATRWSAPSTPSRWPCNWSATRSTPTR